MNDSQDSNSDRAGSDRAPSDRASNRAGETATAPPARGRAKRAAVKPIPVWRTRAFWTGRGGFATAGGLVLVVAIASVLIFQATRPSPAAAPATPTASPSQSGPTDGPSTPSQPTPSASSPTALPTSTAPQPAITAGRKVLLAWARPNVEAGQWWRALSPMLSPSARQAYVGTNPKMLPKLSINGVDSSRPGPNALTATVWFATPEGRYGVDLTRRTAQDRWLGARILFPGQESTFPE